MPSHPSNQLSSEPEKYLQEKLTGSIWIQNKKYPYLFEPNGTCEILNHSRSGHYTISTDGCSVLLNWTNPAFTEELFVLADGSFFLGGSVLVPSNKPRNHYFPCYPIAQPDLNNYQFEIDTGKMPNYGNIILDGRQVRLIKSGYGGNLLSDELREFDSEEAAEEYYHSTIRGEDPYYAPGHINEPIYLELSDDKSHKFYEVTVNGLTVTFGYGRIGTTGQTEKSTYGSPRKAQAAAQKKINEKLKKGYVLFPKGKPSRSKSTEVPLPAQMVKESSNDDSPNSDLDITQFVRPAWKPIVTEGDGDRLASKFSGRPWLAIDETWPGCPCCAEPLQLFVQLNLSQLPEPVREEFGTGLLQMFHCMSDKCGFEVEEGTIYYGRVPFLIKNIKIRLVQPVGMGSTPPLPQIGGEDYGTYLPAKTITEWLEIEDYPDPDELVALVSGWERLGENDLWDAVVERLGLDDLDDYDQLYPTDESDKLGGYPRWVQGLECPGCPVCQAPMRQVFQLASEQNLNYAFGDLGIAHILQCKTHKDQFAFVWACG
ncbi:WGR domain-containing protein [Planktothrix sp. PCC 11201]|uniref:WGR domain-containing protein n=1 Tax=Planktothrix sp. PCC 11201 TaxID=1729650 RepID=UPI00190EA7F3|nr:WGR domain-containing protein [Planktothrix sp. PCC 11201]